MAKRKKKKNKGKAKQKAIPSVNRDYAADVKTALAEGRARKALGFLKEARKAGIDLDGELIVDAYILRMEEMLERGQSKEATEMFENIVRPLAEWQKTISPAKRLETMLRLGLDDGWATYGDDSADTAAMDDVILTRINDPRTLAEHPGLSQNHPLKQQAVAVTKAWSLVDDGRSRDALEHLKAIGRRSPFRGWRVFIQALIAHYDNDDAAVESLCNRIPAEAAVQAVLRVSPDESRADL